MAAAPTTTKATTTGATTTKAPDSGSAALQVGAGLLLAVLANIAAVF